ncbi:MAG: hypothetical protein WCG93_05655 [Paludibacter sp.]
MPKGVFIQDEKVMERFRTVVQDSIPFSLKVNKNISKLAQLIFEKTRNPISESTLKRLFLYPDTTIPSLYTLDTVCQAIGFADWNDFTKKENPVTDFEHLEIITMVRQNGYRDFDEFSQIISRFADTPNKYEVTLALLQVALAKKDIETLSQLFDIPNIFDLIDYNSAQFYFTQELGLNFRNSPLLKDLILIYAKHPVAQESYIERFVDEDHLNGYYGELLEHYHKHKRNLEAQLFFHCLMCQRDIENGILKSPHFDFLIHFRETEPVHPIPKMRRLALLIVYFSNDKEIVDSLLDEIPVYIANENQDLCLFVTLIFCQIVFINKDQYALKRMFQYMNFTTNHYTQNINMLRYANLLKIYEAYVLLGDGKLQEAKSKLSSFNPLHQCPKTYNLHNKNYEIVSKMISDEISKIITL